jgi:hypothetical protein
MATRSSGAKLAKPLNNVRDEVVSLYSNDSSASTKQREDGFRQLVGRLMIEEGTVSKTGDGGKIAAAYATLYDLLHILDKTPAEKRTTSFENYVSELRETRPTWFAEPPSLEITVLGTAHKADTRAKGVVEEDVIRRLIAEQLGVDSESGVTARAMVLIGRPKGDVPHPFTLKNKAVSLSPPLLIAYAVKCGVTQADLQNRFTDSVTLGAFPRALHDALIDGLTTSAAGGPKEEQVRQYVLSVSVLLRQWLRESTDDLLEFWSLNPELARAANEHAAALGRDFAFRVHGQEAGNAFSAVASFSASDLPLEWSTWVDASNKVALQKKGGGGGGGGGNGGRTRGERRRLQREKNARKETTDPGAGVLGRDPVTGKKKIG